MGLRLGSELMATVGEAASTTVIEAHKAGKDPKAPLKEAFTKLMTCDKELVAMSLADLVRISLSICTAFLY
jgi:hypothetical protein